MLIKSVIKADTPRLIIVILPLTKNAESVYVTDIQCIINTIDFPFIFRDEEFGSKEIKYE